MKRVGAWCISISKISDDFDVYWGNFSVRFQLVWKIGPCYDLYSTQAPDRRMALPICQISCSLVRNIFLSLEHYV